MLNYSYLQLEGVIYQLLVLAGQKNAKGLSFNIKSLLKQEVHRIVKNVDKNSV